MKSKGFTPVIDTIRDDVGRTPALVYGVMYRFSRMSELRICMASQSKIAEVAGVGRDTVIQAQTALQERGYITKTGYSTGGRITWACNVTITGQIEMFVEEVSEKSTGGVGKSDRLPKKEVKKDKDLVDGIIKYQSRDVLDVMWFPPDIEDYLLRFALKFKARYKREATKRERGFWIAECREWKQRGYKQEDVTRAWEYATEQGTVIKSPRSITYAFDQLKPDENEFVGREM